MGATATNQRTNQTVNAQATPSDAVSSNNLLVAMVGDKIKVNWTVSNVGNTSGRFRVVWATGVGDLVSDTFTLDAGQNLSGSFEQTYNSTMSAVATTISVQNLTTGKADHNLYIGIRVDAGAPKGRIDHPDLSLIIGDGIILSIGALSLSSVIRKWLQQRQKG